MEFGSVGAVIAAASKIVNAIMNAAKEGNGSAKADVLKAYDEKLALTRGRVSA